MKKTVLLSALMVTLVCLLIGGATFAYFSDSATNAANTFTAGTVQITAERDLGDPIPGPMFYTTKEEGQVEGGSLPNWPTGLWFPGKVETRTLIVKNTGTLDVNLDGLSAEISNITNSAVAQEFAERMNVSVKPQAMPSLVIYDGPLSGLTSGKVAATNLVPTSAGGGQWYLDFTITMDSGAGNDLQGIVPKVAFSIYASQK